MYKSFDERIFLNTNEEYRHFSDFFKIFDEVLRIKNNQ